MSFLTIYIVKVWGLKHQSLCVFVWWLVQLVQAEVLWHLYTVKKIPPYISQIMRQDYLSSLKGSWKRKKQLIFCKY